MISTYGQQLLDAANEGKKFDQEMSKHFYLSKKDSHVIRSIGTVPCQVDTLNNEN